MLTELPGSRPPRCSSRVAREPDRQRVHEVVFHLRPRPSSGGLGWVNRQALRSAGQRQVLDWSEYAAAYGAAPDDVATIRRFASAHDLVITHEDPQTRRIVVAGPIGTLERAFGITVQLHTDHHQEHLGHDGPLWVPSAVRVATRAVLGLDACTRLRWPAADGPRPASEADGVPSVADSEVRRLLGIPDGLDGQGRAVALVCVGADDESIELGTLRSAVTAAAPAARVVTHRGGDTVRELVDAVLTALRDRPAPSVLVIAGGAPEHEWSGGAIRMLEQLLLSAGALGVAVVVGSGSGQAWFPATSPHVVACCPSDRRRDGGKSARSTVFPAPTWQERAATDAIEPRVVPDVWVPVTPAAHHRAETVSLPVLATGYAAGTLAVVAQGLDSAPGLVMPLLAGDHPQPIDADEGAGVALSADQLIRVLATHPESETADTRAPLVASPATAPSADRGTRPPTEALR